MPRASSRDQEYQENQEDQEDQELPVIRFDDTFYALGIDIVSRLTRKDKQVYADKFKYSES
ncbi:MAG: hypothetical protein J7J06_04950 [Methanosarcinales archaeon]|nr:hypothetical protein [Methanosarcinales archaeon]